MEQKSPSVSKSVMILLISCIFINLCMYKYKHHDIQHNDIQHNDIQHSDTRHNDIQHNSN
jgi:hypothetical protein